MSADGASADARPSQPAGAGSDAAQGAPELRLDAVSGDWIIFAPRRAGRPHDHALAAGLRPSAAPAACPFCPGREAETPAEVYALRDGPPDSPGWRVRVVPSKYAALETGLASLPQPSGERLAGRGHHEVFIETPRHAADLADLSQAEVVLVLETWRERSRVALGDPAVQAVVIFRNKGPRSGASRAHPHSQLLALPLVPPGVERRLARAAEAFARAGRCPFCALVTGELAAGVRIVATTPRFAAFAPYASRFAWQLWLAPRQHAPAFEAASDAELGELAWLLGEVLARLRRTLGEFDYNLALQTSPRGAEGRPDLSWWLELIPRVAGLGGLELGVGLTINTVLPEQAAAVLRAAGASDAAGCQSP